MSATPATSAPASRAASTAVNGLAPVVVTSSTMSTRRPDIERTLDALLHSVLFLGLADHERVDRALSGMHDRRGHRVGAEGEATDRVVIPIGR